MGRLTSSIGKASSLLESLPALRPVSRGTRLRYALAGLPSQSLQGSPVFEVDRQSLRLTFYFDLPRPSEYSANFLKLLSLVAFLKDHFSPELWSIYRYFIEFQRNCILKDEGIGGVADERLRMQVDALSNSNWSISASFAELERKHTLAVAELQLYKRFCSELITGIKDRTFKEGGIFDALTAFGIEQPMVQKVLDSLLADEKKVKARTMGT